MVFIKSVRLKWVSPDWMNKESRLKVDPTIKTQIRAVQEKQGLDYCIYSVWYLLFIWSEFTFCFYCIMLTSKLLQVNGIFCLDIRSCTYSSEEQHTTSHSGSFCMILSKNNISSFLHSESVKYELLKICLHY